MSTLNLLKKSNRLRRYLSLESSPTAISRHNFDNRLYLHRYIEWELGSADRRARVVAGIAPQLEHQVAEPVDHARRRAEAGRAVDEPEELDPAAHAVEVAELPFQRREDRQRREPRGLVSLFGSQVGAHLAAKDHLRPVQRAVPRYIRETAADAHEVEA